VRRALAIALLAVFGFWLIPPSAFASDPEAGLPACCRRNGKHHCSQVGWMASATDGSSTPALHALPCSSFPQSVVTASPNAGALPAPGVSFVSLTSVAVNDAAEVTPAAVLFRSPRQQRGPPASLVFF
jgi:hypothetical protein